MSTETVRTTGPGTTGRARVGRGVPAGGQFATDSRTEPDISLVADPPAPVDLVRALTAHLDVRTEDVQVVSQPMTPVNLPLVGEVVEQVTYEVQRDPDRWSSVSMLVRRNLSGDVVVGAIEVERLHDQAISEGHAMRLNLLSRHLETFDDQTVAEALSDLDRLADVNDRLAAGLYLPQVAGERVASRRTWVALTGERRADGAVRMNVSRDGQVVCLLDVAEDGRVLDATVSGAGIRIEADDPDELDAVCEHIAVSIDTAAGRDPQGPGAWTRADLEGRLRAAFVGDLGPGQVAVRDPQCPTRIVHGAEVAGSGGRVGVVTADGRRALVDPSDVVARTYTAV